MAKSSNEEVLLHQFERIYPKLPSVSPFCMKLETFLRMAKIPYKVDSVFKRSSKGKVPWIEHKGKIVADSGFCIEYLSKEFGVDVDSDLTPEQKAIARAFRVMLEENTFWIIAYYRWCSADYATRWREEMLHKFPTPVRHIIQWRAQRMVRNDTWGHGIGRHTEEEMYCIAEKDLRAVSTYLGSKKFLFGDKPCLADASVFAHVGSFIWGMFGSPQETLINEHLQNLKEHAERMMEMYFPDIDELYRVDHPDDPKQADAKQADTKQADTKQADTKQADTKQSTEGGGDAQ